MVNFSITWKYRKITFWRFSQKKQKGYIFCQKKMFNSNTTHVLFSCASPHVWRAICTSVPLRASIRVSPDLDFPFLQPAVHLLLTVTFLFSAALQQTVKFPCIWGNTAQANPCWRTHLQQSSSLSRGLHSTYSGSLNWLSSCEQDCKYGSNCRDRDAVSRDLVQFAVLG